MTQWIVDQAHTEVGFKVKHLVISTVRGNFSQFEGSVTTEGDDFSTANVQMRVSTDSVQTNNAMRDGHLKSADFFDVEHFPIMSFESTSVKKTSETEYQLQGVLTIRGVAKPVGFAVTFHGMTKGMEGVRVAVFEAVTTISREDFGLSWNQVLETGGVVVGDMVTIEMAVELKEQVI